MVRLIGPLRLVRDVSREKLIPCFTISFVSLGVGFGVAYLVILDNTLHYVEDDPATTVSLSLPTTIIAVPTSTNPMATTSLLDAIGGSLVDQATTSASLSLSLATANNFLTIATVSNPDGPLKSILTAIGENPSSLMTLPLSLSSLATSASAQVLATTAAKSDATAGLGNGVGNSAILAVAMVACLLRLAFT